jgi:very-short-patch-repair endonuclease
MKVYYNPNMKELSRKLRNNSTLSEVLLWQQIKGRKIKGYQFTRQKSIGIYIVDFYCSKLRLGVEIDGISHDGKAEEDQIRQNCIEKMGIRFLRFYDTDVKRNMAGVIQKIADWIEKKTNQETTPLPPLIRGNPPRTQHRD